MYLVSASAVVVQRVDPHEPTYGGEHGKKTRMRDRIRCSDAVVDIP